MTSYTRTDVVVKVDVCFLNVKDTTNVSVLVEGRIFRIFLSVKAAFILRETPRQTNMATTDTTKEGD